METRISEIADGIEDLMGVMDSVQHQLADVLDAEMARAIQRETMGGGQRIEAGGFQVELEPAGAGQVVAYIDTSDGERIISCTLRPFNESASSLRRTLGLEEASDEEMERLMELMGKMAA